MILPSMAVIVAIFVPAEVLAEDGEQWSEIRAWKELSENQIPVLIIRDAKVSESQVDIVENAINSKETHDLNGIHFLGWNEGIKEISKSFGVKVPTLQVKQHLENENSITIYLMDKSNNDGFDGFTNLFYDGNGKIIKAFVKIYNTDELSKSQLESIIRHKLGHALGLGHTNMKNDLMQPIIDINNNTISMFDLHALAMVY